MGTFAIHINLSRSSSSYSKQFKLDEVLSLRRCRFIDRSGIALGRSVGPGYY
jgi:hypothetical protein